MKFIDSEHQEFYKRMIEKTNSHDDPYRKALFYTLGLSADTRNHIHDLYDFKERGIDFDALGKGWQTSGNIKITRLAFNLYNGFSGRLGDEEIDEPEMYSPYNLFDTGLSGYFFEAVKLRYPEYCRGVEDYELFHGDDCEPDEDDEDEYAL